MTASTSTVDEAFITERIAAIGAAIEAAGDLGFVLTYHAARGDHVGVMQLAGSGVDQELLGQLLADALTRNAENGDTL